MTTHPQVQLSGIPERIFISVDERTGSSTVSFSPPDIGAPIVREDDAQGDLAMAMARTIAAGHPGCTIGGPHFHTSRPNGPTRRRRR